MVSVSSDDRLYHHTLVVNSAGQRSAWKRDASGTDDRRYVSARANSAYVIDLPRVYTRVKRVELLEYIMPNTMYPFNRDTARIKVSLLKHAIMDPAGASVLARSVELTLDHTRNYNAEELALALQTQMNASILGNPYTSNYAAGQSFKDVFEVKYNELTLKLEVACHTYIGSTVNGVTTYDTNVTVSLQHSYAWLQFYDAPQIGFPDPLYDPGPDYSISTTREADFNAARLNNPGLLALEGVNASPVSAPTPPQVYNSAYLVLTIDELAATQNALKLTVPYAPTGGIPPNPFAMIQMDAATGHLNVFRAHGRLSTYSCVVPRGNRLDLNKLSVRITDLTGNLVDFNGVHHQLVLGIYAEDS